MESKKELAARTAAALVEKIQSESRLWQAEGRDAWTALKRLGSGNLAQGDEIVIARRLYQEMEALKIRLKSAKIGLGELCLRAGIGNEGDYSKELYRMTLAPDREPSKVGLRKSAAKYRQLIAAIGQATKESTSSLANRLLLGTTLHPANVKDWTEIEQVQVALQTIVDVVDKEFGLYEKYMETAQLKAGQTAEGAPCFWPHWDIDRTFYQEGDEGDREYESDMKRVADHRHAFWPNPVRAKHSDYWWTAGMGSNCLQDCEFFYLPHAYIGSIEFANLPERDDDSLRHFKALESRAAEIREQNEAFGWEPADEWDEQEQRPVGQTSSGWEWQEHGWLVIYPTPDNQRLMPMFYIPYEEGGAFLLPLDAGNLRGLQKAYWVGRTEVSTVFERIKRLIGHLPGTCPSLLEGFRRTAPWFGRNPLLKLRDRKQDEQILLQDFCKKLWTSA